MRLIANGELSVLFVNNYLAYYWRVNIIPKVLSLYNDAGFYLKHFDDKGDYILVTKILT